MTKNKFTQQFKDDVSLGLTAYPKKLSSQYIYDQRGDALFQEIMGLPEYYLTRYEHDILKQNAEGIARAFMQGRKEGFDLIELGAGDGFKTKTLLHALRAENAQFTYKPIDISGNVLEGLEHDLAALFPGLDIAPEVGTYFSVLEELANQDRPKVIMMLGSNIGNLQHKEAINFLNKLREGMDQNDVLFMGFDMKKDPLTIQNAYSDKKGVTQEFNRNLLHRINGELGGHFDVNKFEHWEAYDPETGTARSFLCATEPMDVAIDALEMTISFDRWETINTEISQKYDDTTIEWLCGEAQLEPVTYFTDKVHGYKNYIIERA